MARLIDVTEVEAMASPITLQSGDVLSFNASGGHVSKGSIFVELLGPFVSADVGLNGEIITPMGSPGIVLIVARHTGKATIELVTGDPFYNPVTTQLEIIVK